MNRKITAGVAAVLFSTSLVIGYHFAMASQNGVYCVDHGTSDFRVFAVSEKKDGNLDVGLMAWRGEGEFSFFGNAKKITKNHWLFEDGMESKNPDDHCAVDIVQGKDGLSITARSSAPCTLFRGATMGGYQVPPFSSGTYVHPVTVELASQETMEHIVDCKNPPKVFAPMSTAP
jgi:hypothetical protein